MKISIPNSTFAPAMKRASGVSKSKSTMPVLADVLLSAEDGQLTMHATDLNNTLSITLDCEVHEEGHLLLEADKLYRLSSKIDGDETVTLQADGQWGLMNAGSLDCRIRGGDPADFPKIPVVEPKKMLSVSSPKLLDMINKTIYSASEDESRANLQGLHLTVMPDKFQLASTDGYRMSLVERPVGDDDLHGDETLSEQGVIIPVKAMEEMAATIKGHTGHITFGVDESRITFRVDNTVMTSLLIDGKFPDFSKVLPPFNYAQAASVDKREMVQAVSIVSLFADKASKRVTMSLQDNQVDVRAVDADAGEAEESVEATYKSEAIKANFNFNFLQDVFGVAEGDRLEILLFDDDKLPAMIKGSDDEDSLFVIVPQR